MRDLPATVLIGIALVDAYAIARAIVRHHGVGTTLAWIFAILAFPLIGAVTYFMVAVPRVRRTARRKRVKAAEIRAALRVGAAPGSAAGGGEGEGARTALLRLTTNLTGFPPSGGNALELLTDDDHAFERIEAALSRARCSVWAEYYIVSNDRTGRGFLDLLARKAAEGVEVRFLYDGVGSLGLDPGRLRAIQKAGGRCEVFFPLNPLRRRWSFNLRNHRKVIVVDGALGFTGGMNIGDKYSGRSRRLGARHFRDSHLELRGPAVGDLARIFAEDWHFATGEELAPAGRPARVDGADSVVAVLPSGPDQELNASSMVYFSGVATARERVWLTSPYFIPDEPLVRALIGSVLRGVDVRLLVPARSDVPIAAMAGRSYYEQLVRGGVRLYRFQPSMLHAKAMVVDGEWGMVGSANVDLRSFNLNFEMSAVVVDAAFARKLEARFLDALEHSVELEAAAFEKYGLLARLRDGAVRLLSPLL